MPETVKSLFTSPDRVSRGPPSSRPLGGMDRDSATESPNRHPLSGRPSGGLERSSATEGRETVLRPETGVPSDQAPTGSRSRDHSGSGNLGNRPSGSVFPGDQSHGLPGDRRDSPLSCSGDRSHGRSRERSLDRSAGRAHEYRDHSRKGRSVTYVPGDPLSGQPGSIIVGARPSVTLTGSQQPNFPVSPFSSRGRQRERSHKPKHRRRHKSSSSSSSGSARSSSRSKRCRRSSRSPPSKEESVQPFSWNQACPPGQQQPPFWPFGSFPPYMWQGQPAPQPHTSHSRSKERHDLGSNPNRKKRRSPSSSSSSVSPSPSERVRPEEALVSRPAAAVSLQRAPSPAPSAAISIRAPDDDPLIREHFDSESDGAADRSSLCSEQSTPFSFSSAVADVLRVLPQDVVPRPEVKEAPRASCTAEAVFGVEHPSSPMARPILPISNMIGQVVGQIDDNIKSKQGASWSLSQKDMRRFYSSGLYRHAPSSTADGFSVASAAPVDDNVHRAHIPRTGSVTISSSQLEKMETRERQLLGIISHTDLFSAAIFTLAAKSEDPTLRNLTMALGKATTHMAAHATASVAELVRLRRDALLSQPNSFLLPESRETLRSAPLASPTLFGGLVKEVATADKDDHFASAVAGKASQGKFKIPKKRAPPSASPSAPPPAKKGSPFPQKPRGFQPRGFQPRSGASNFRGQGRMKDNRRPHPSGPPPTKPYSAPRAAPPSRP